MVISGRVLLLFPWLIFKKWMPWFVIWMLFRQKKLVLWFWHGQCFFVSSQLSQGTRIILSWWYRECCIIKHISTWKNCDEILKFLLDKFQEIDHGNYARQAIEAASLCYFLEILESNILKESEVTLKVLTSEWFTNKSCI